MKLLIVLACAVIASCAPLENIECEDLLTVEQCAAFDAIDQEVLDDNNAVRERRQLSPDNELLVQLVKKKLEFLINLGLLRNIPLLGQKIEELVRNDPDGVARALAGGIGGLIQLGLQLLGGGLLGR